MNGTLNGALQNELSEIESNIIGELLINLYLTQQEIAEKLKCSERTINRTFIELWNKNVVTRVGSKRDGYWKILK